MQPQLRVKKLSKHATLPFHGSALSAGYDLASAYDAEIPAFSKGLVKTDLAFEIPKGHYGHIAPRSSLSLKHFIDVGGGIIDGDYRGNVGVILYNFSDKPFNVKVGDRIAQIIFEKYSSVAIKEVDTLNDTSRGLGGFGSTGK